MTILRRHAGPAARAVATVLAVLCASSAWGWVGAASVASAVPSASAAADLGAYPNLEAWLDQAPPPDAPAGTTIVIGLTIWDSHQAQFTVVSGLYLKLHPATGRARPTEAEIQRSGWPGHFLANVIVPKGGPGAVEVVVRDQTDLPVHVGGVGPPPSAPLSSLVGAQVHLPSGPAIAGQPMDLVVDVRPEVEWDPPPGLPDRLVVIATLGRGPDLANTEIHRAAGSTTSFAGPITIPQAGDVELVFAFPGGTTGADDIIQGATTRILVRPGSDAPAPAAGPPPPADGGPAWPLIGGAAALILAAAFVIRRVFADL
jgi:hypothetical protein